MVNIHVAFVSYGNIEVVSSLQTFYSRSSGPSQDLEVNKFLLRVDHDKIRIRQFNFWRQALPKQFSVALTILPPKWLFTAAEGAQEYEGQGPEVLEAVEVAEVVVLEDEVDSKADEGNQYSIVLE